jgi:hypothetical protein
MGHCALTVMQTLSASGSLTDEPVAEIVLWKFDTAVNVISAGRS